MDNEGFDCGEADDEMSMPDLAEDSEDEDAYNLAGATVERKSAKVQAPIADQHVLNQVIKRAVNEVIRPALTLPWTNYFTNKFPSIVSGLAPSLVLPKVLREDFGTSTNQIVPAQTAMRIASGSLMHAAVARIHVVPWPEQCVANRAKALQRWRLILEENLSASELGRNLHDMAVSLESDIQMTELIDHTFADRKATTLNKRAGPILKYLMWHRSSYGTAGIPLVESRCYIYFRGLKTGSATSGQSFLSALRFAHFVVKLVGAQTIFESARIKGIAHLMYSKKRPLKQRRALKVSEVRSLEKLAQYAEHGWDRYFCCFILLLIYLRARYNDAARQRKVIADFHKETGGYLEVSVLDSKTQRSAESKTTYLPLVGPAVGISGCKWGIRFLQERKEQRIEEFCLMPTPSRSGGWLDAPLELTSANRWLRDLLKLAGHHSALEDVGSHSCKATTLSWCAKAGVNLISRSLLGYHSVKQFGTVLVYSRDAMAQPLRELDAVLNEIRSKAFLPDETRSGRLIKKSRIDENQASAAIDPYQSEPPVVVEEPFLDEPSSELENESSSSSSSGNSSSGSSSSKGATDTSAFNVLAKVRPKMPDETEHQVAYYHATSGILHYRNRTEPRLKCGRTLSDNLCPILWDGAMGLIRCMVCFSKQQ